MKTISIKWIKAAGVRALKTAAQTAVASMGVSVFISDINWVAYKELKSMVGLPEVKED